MPIYFDRKQVNSTYISNAYLKESTNMINENSAINSEQLSVNLVDVEEIKLDDSNYRQSNSFRKTIDDLFTNSKTAFIQNKAANLAMIAGTIVSFATNYLAGKYAGDNNFSYSGIDWTSYLFEAAPHLLTSGIVFWKSSRNKGLSRKDTVIDMAIVGVLTSALSLGAYKPIRDVISNTLMDAGLNSGSATFRAQLYLIGAYMPCSSLLSYFTLKKLGRFKNKNTNANRTIFIDEKQSSL